MGGLPHTGQGGVGKKDREKQPSKQASKGTSGGGLILRQTREGKRQLLQEKARGKKNKSHAKEGLGNEGGLADRERRKQFKRLQRNFLKVGSWGTGEQRL